MKNLYRFEKFLLEADKADTMGDFVEKFSDRISSIGSDLEKQKEESDKLKKPTGFDQAKGNEFRKWMSENHSDFKDSSGEPLSYKEGKDFSYNNKTIKEAYGKYGEEWKKSKK